MEPPTPILLNLLTFFLGLFIGNWLAIGRDRRKELNEAAQTIREILLKQRKNPTPYSRDPTQIDIDLLERLLPIWRRRGFRKTVARYSQSKQHTKRDSAGGMFFIDDGLVKVELEKLLRYTNWR